MLGDVPNVLALNPRPDGDHIARIDTDRMGRWIVVWELEHPEFVIPNVLNSPLSTFLLPPWWIPPGTLPPWSVWAPPGSLGEFAEAVLNAWWRVITEVGFNRFGTDGDILWSASDDLIPKPFAMMLAHTIPERMSAGQSLLAGVRVWNVSDDPWTPDGIYKLTAIEDPCGLWAHPEPGLPPALEVGLGRHAVFSVPLTPPPAAGQCTLSLQMLREFDQFFGDVLEATVEIVEPPNAAADWERFE
jgi:hypothetical protein